MTTFRKVAIESFALIALGAIGLWGGLGSYLKVDARMASSALKPGMFVAFLGAGLVLTGVIYAIGGWRAHRRRAAAAGEGEGIEPIVLAVFAATVVYTIAMPYVGYLASTLVFLLAQFRLLGVTSWKTNLIASVLTTAFFDIVFVRYGGLDMPSGIFFAPG